uniref:Uncharacterized protein n=1 Tax=Rhizophora mucronata TaxID=61149 RepID=A0A2P2P5K4_RHIMU
MGWLQVEEWWILHQKRIRNSHL